MKTTKWIRSAVLATALLAIAGVIAVLACGPAASTQRSVGVGSVAAKEEPTRTSTPTVNLHPDCVTLPLPDGGKATSCPPPGPENVESNFRRHYNYAMATKESGVRGSVAEPVYVDVVVNMDSVATMRTVAEFLEIHEDVGKIDLYPRAGRYGAAVLVANHVNMELISEIADIEGVVRVEKIQTTTPLSSQGQPAPNPAVLKRMGVDDWHAAGVTGSGVEVAVIDSGFKDFRTRVMPSLSEPAKFLCYDSFGEAYEGYVPTLTPTPGATPVVTPGPTPTPKFVACEEGTDHGTVSVESLFEVAPDVNLRISDANRSDRYIQAVDWWTAGPSDNAIAATRVYDVRANDGYNVQVISHSGGALWDGPGDGTSDRVLDEERSPLNIVKDAEGGGTMWVNAAGNSAEQTWYSTFVPFNRPVEGVRYLDFSSISYPHTGGNNPCNRVTLEAGNDYLLQSRWDGNWRGDDVDLEVHLVREAGTDDEGNAVPPLIVSSTGNQAGPGTAPPFEKLEFSTGDDLGGDYCVLITRDSGERDLDWLQFQIFSGGGDMVFHTKTGSMTNPAESASEDMIAVGASRFRLELPATLPPSPTPFPTASVELWDYSARGPVPEITDRRKPELVGINTDVLGTSDAAPQVAGVAALVAQVVGPSASLRYLSEIVSGYRGDIDLAQLPSLEAPTNVRVSQGACPGRRLEVQFDHPSTFRPLISFEARAVQSTVGGGSGAVFEGSGSGTARIEIGTDRGAYDVTVRACAGGEYCGPWSSPPTRFTTTSMVCKPSWFQAVPGDGNATLWWNPDPDATGYRVDSGEGTASQVVSGEEHVVEGLTNGTSYTFRVRALGPGSPSDWRRGSVTPQASRSRPSEPTNLRVEENHSRRFPGVALKWDAPFGSYLYEVRISGGGANLWRRLPFKPGGEASPHSPYSARIFGSYGRAGDVTDPVVNIGQAIIAGLVPGTEYHLAVRAARERDTGSGKRLYRSPWSKPVTVTTPGTRPANAPGSATAPPLKAPPKDLMAVVDGTTVNLSWTATTNPNHVRQVLRRRDVSVNPAVWTEIPVGLGETAYRDEGLASGVTYRYRVRAYKDNGHYGQEQGGFADAVIP